MNNSIVNFKTAFNGGTRPNRFQVVPNWPAGIRPQASDPTFKMTSSSLPKALVNTIGVPYRGRTIYYPGDRTYSPWLIGILDDGNTENLWRAMQRWKEAMDGHYTHNVQNNNFSYDQLQTTWKIRQLDINGTNEIRSIELYKCWPNIVGQIDLNMGETNFVAFTISLVFDSMKIVRGLRTNSGGSQ